MYARMSVFEGPPEYMDESLSQLREQFLSQLRQQDGFKGFIALGDRQTGKTLSVSFWESEEALRASEREAARMRRESAETSGDTIAGVETYEVGLFEMSS